MSMICKEIVKRIEEKYPLYMAEDYDNVGLIIGDYAKEVNKIMLCLEINSDVVREAMCYNVDMIISHHPLIFKSLKKITSNNHITSMIMKLIKSDINVYAMHTNFDNAEEGMNDLLAELLCLKKIDKLSYNKNTNLFKIAVYVPKTHEDVVREAIFKAGGGHIGNYSNCSFNIKGVGTFMSGEGTSPYIGKEDVLEKVDEVKIETVVMEKQIDKVISSILAVHPYEEVAYDVYALKNQIPQGTGRYGILDSPLTLSSFCEYVKQKLNVPYLNVSGDLNSSVSKVAVVGGAGSDFIIDAVRNGCDTLITGDVKHHDALDAVEMGINIIDAGHYFTEIPAIEYISKFIKLNFDVQCIISQTDTNPFKRV